MVVDLRSGRSLRASDVFDRTTFKAMTAMVNTAMAADQQQAIAKAKGESEGLADQLKQHTFRLKHLNDFGVDDRGVTFRYNYGFPHVSRALEPEGRYFFSYDQLKPFIRKDGALGQFVN